MNEGVEAVRVVNNQESWRMDCKRDQTLGGQAGE